MNKKLTIVIALLLIAGCANEQPNLALWMYGDSDVPGEHIDKSIGGRIGYLKDNDANGTYEIGVGTIWFPDQDADAPQIWTGYMLYHWPQILTIPQPIPVEWLPQEVKATAYSGAQVGLNIDNDSGIAGPIAGVIIEDTIPIEWQWQNAYSSVAAKGIDDEHKLIIAWRWKF